MRKIAIIVLNIVFMISIIGCKPRQEKKEILFNARFYGFGSFIDLNKELKNDTLKFKFLETNRIKGIRYKNESSNPYSSSSNETIYYPDAPDNITYIINSQEKANEIFNKEMEINYDEEMLILYLFGSYGLSVEIDSVKLENKKLYININKTIQENPINYMGMYLIVRLDKIDINDVSFVFNKVEGKTSNDCKNNCNLRYYK